MLYTHAQEKSYYALVEEGEGDQKAFCLKFNGHQMVDTLYFIDNVFQGVPNPVPHGLERWKPWFRKIIPFKARVEDLVVGGDTMKFQTAKCFHDGNLWFSFRFTGKKVRDQIRRRSTQIQYTGFQNDIYTDDYKIRFSQ